MSTIYFVINPQAKNGYALKVWQRVKTYMAQVEREYFFYLTKYPGHATEIATHICSLSPGMKKAIIVIGGDGTIHEVINGVVGCDDVEIGVIPAGSGNDFSRGFGVPKEITAALQLILDADKEPKVKVDIGEIVDEKGKKSHFINNMGSGFDAWIAKKVNESKMKGMLNRLSLGRLTYAYYVVKELFTYRQAEVKITIDNKDYYFHNTWFVTISNQPYYGGGMKIAPKASTVDGSFDITVVSELHPLKFLFVFVTVFWGGHLRFKEVTTFSGKYIHIHSSHPLTSHADGEYIGHTPVQVQLMERHLPVISNGVD